MTETELIETLELIRDDCAHERNAFLTDNHWRRDKAQKKVDAMNIAILRVLMAPLIQAAE